MASGSMHRSLARARRDREKAFGLLASLISPRQAAGPATRSQGYGIAISAAIGDKETFSQLWNFVRHHLSQSAKKYCGGLMGWMWDGRALYWLLPSTRSAITVPGEMEGTWRKCSSIWMDTCWMVSRSTPLDRAVWVCRYEQ